MPKEVVVSIQLNKITSDKTHGIARSASRRYIALFLLYLLKIRFTHL